jgi:hypothetical protein
MIIRRVYLLFYIYKDHHYVLCKIIFRKVLYFFPVIIQTGVVTSFIQYQIRNLNISIESINLSFKTSQYGTTLKSKIIYG